VAIAIKSTPSRRPRKSSPTGLAGLLTTIPITEAMTTPGTEGKNFRLIMIAVSVDQLGGAVAAAGGGERPER
jgi:hypothetical protein